VASESYCALIPRALITPAHLAVSLSMNLANSAVLMSSAADVERIASELKISVNTARGYIQNILEKLGAHSRLEAVVRATELGLLGA